MQHFSNTELFLMAVAGLVLIGKFTGLISTWLKHRREMVKMKLEGQAQKQNGGESAELRQRLEALEKKCTEMQEQITDAHMLLADERRALDKKLAESFPEVSASGSESRTKAPVRERI